MEPIGRDVVLDSAPNESEWQYGRDHRAAPGAHAAPSAPQGAPPRLSAPRAWRGRADEHCTCSLCIKNHGLCDEYVQGAQIDRESSVTRRDPAACADPDRDQHTCDVTRHDTTHTPHTTRRRTRTETITETAPRRNTIYSARTALLDLARTALPDLAGTRSTAVARERSAREARLHRGEPVIWRCA